MIKQSMLTNFQPLEDNVSQVEEVTCLLIGKKNHRKNTNQKVQACHKFGEKCLILKKFSMGKPLVNQCLCEFRVSVHKFQYLVVYMYWEELDEVRSINLCVIYSLRLQTQAVLVHYRRQYWFELLKWQKYAHHLVSNTNQHMYTTNHALGPSFVLRLPKVRN